MLDLGVIRELLRSAVLRPGVSIPSGATEADIRAFESRCGFALPEDLADWLRVSNGPFVGPGFFGINRVGSDVDTASIESMLELYPQWAKKKWIPVAGDGCGNYYVLVTQKEFGDGLPVFFVDTIQSSDEPTYFVASDIAHFLVFFLEDELNRPIFPEKSWPFGKEYVLERDPDILKFRNDLLPWEVDKRSRGERRD